MEAPGTKTFQVTVLEILVAGRSRIVPQEVTDSEVTTTGQVVVAFARCLGVRSPHPHVARRAPSHDA